MFTDRRVKILYAIVTACGLTIRILFILRAEWPGPGDASSRYYPAAVNLLAGRGLSWQTSPPYLINTFDVPGYPLFAAGVIFVFGDSIFPVAIVQLILELLTIALVWIISKEIGLSDNARAAAVAVALICPVIPFFNARLLTETLATCALAFLLYCSIRIVKSTGALWTALFGATAGLMLMIRPDMIICVALLFAACVVIARSWTTGLIIPGLIVLCLVPWTLRNYRLTGEILPLGRVAEQTNDPYVKWLDTWVDDPALIESFWWHRQMDPSTDYRAKADAAISERPIYTRLFVPAKRATLTWAKMPGYFSPGQKPFVYAFWFLFSALICAGLALYLRDHPGAGALLACVIVGRFALPVLSAIGAEPRYLIETLPACFILAGLACATIWQRFKPKLSPTKR